MSLNSKTIIIKKQILFLSCLFAAVLLTSCEKETLAGNEAIDVQEAPIKKVVFNLPSNGRSPESSTTMLQFATFEDFKATIEQLENALEAHEDAFYALYGHLDEEALETMEQQLGFNENQPLIDFKTQQDFTNSMFDVTQAQMQVWKQSETSTPENDPESLIDFDPVEQVLFNYNGEVMIGGKIYSYDKPDYHYEIIDEYENSLTKINNGEDVSDDPNILLTSRHEHRTCYDHRRIQDYRYFNNNNRRVQRRVAIRAYNQGKDIRTSTKIVSYKKVRNSWRRRASYISVRNDSNYNIMSNCSRTKENASHQGTLKKRKQRTVRHWYNNNTLHGVEKNYGLKGTYRYGSASSGSGANIITVKFLE